MTTHNPGRMTAEQIEVLNVTMEVLGPLVLSLGLANKEALPRVGQFLKGFAALPNTSPAAADMLRTLVAGVEVTTGQRPPN